jgi:hypothetical protein
MAITSLNDVAIGLSSTSRQTMIINKASIASQVANNYCSLWRATGWPVQPAIPAAVTICDKTTVGAWNFTYPSGGQSLYLAAAKMTMSVAGNGVEVHDRLVHMGGLSGIVTTAQTVGLVVSGSTSNLQARLGNSDLSELQWWLECYTTTGVTAVNFTAAVTNTDLSTSNIVIAPGASMAASRLFPVIPAAGKKIKSIDTVTLSASTGTAGNFGFSVTREITSLEITNVSYMRKYTWAETELSPVLDSTCLSFIVACASSSTGALLGNLRLIQA